MREVVLTSKIKKDLKTYRKRGIDLAPFYEIVDRIANGVLLDPSNEDHPLHGKYLHKRDCHIEPDWLLIYAVDKKEVVLYRTGTHSDIYG